MKPYLKILLAVVMLACSVGAQAQRTFTKYKSPENTIDAYITLPSAACDSIMIKSARYHCVMNGFYHLLDGLSKQLPRTSEGRAEMKRIADRLGERDKVIREKYLSEMASYLKLVTPGTKLAFRNSSGKIEITEVALVDLTSFDRLVSDRPAYELTLSVKAINKIPCGTDGFNLTWNFMICDSQGREVDVVTFVFKDFFFTSISGAKYYESTPGYQSPEWYQFVRSFNAGSDFAYDFVFRISAIYDARYDCSSTIAAMNLDDLLTAQAQDSVRKPTPPAPARKPEPTPKPESAPQPTPRDSIAPQPAPQPVDSLSSGHTPNPKEPRVPQQKPPQSPSPVDSTIDTTIKIDVPPTLPHPPQTDPNDQHHHQGWRPRPEQGDSIPPLRDTLIDGKPGQKPDPETPPNSKPKPDPKPTPMPIIKPLPQQNYARRLLGSHYSEGLLPVRSDGGKWGYVNVDGLWVIAPQFIKGNLSRPYFSDGVAVMQSGNNTVLLFPDGKMVALAKDIQNVSEFRNGYAMVQRSGENWTTKYGFIDKQGREVFSHLTKTGASGDIYPLGKLSEGLMRYYDAEKRMFGYLDAAGKVVLQPQWEHAGDFSEGLAAAYGSDWGYIDLQGNWAIKPQWDYQDKPSDFHNGVAAVNKGYISKSGERLKEMTLPYPFVGSWSYNTNTDEDRLEMISASLAVVKSLSLRLAPGKIDGVRQMAFPSGYCTLQRGSYPGDFTEMQATVVVDPQLSIVLDTEKTEHLISVGNFYDGRATAFSKQAHDWDTDPDCIVDITGKILFRIQK